jgi:prephenate dehydratase
VVRETLLRIRHNLIAVAGAAMDEIDRVYSHAVALGQCRRFLAEHPQMKAVAFYDTAGSVKQLVNTRDKKAAAIASEQAAAYYGAEILARGIEDDEENYTRFFLVERSAEAKTDAAANKMSVAFTLEHKPGSLVAALSALSEMGTNLTAIESRPVKGTPWEYIFYVDCKIGAGNDGTRDDGTRAIEALRAHCGMVKELGRYREAGS